MGGQHHYNLTVTWTGNTGSGTSGYRSYERSHTIAAANKAVIAGSSDPSFRGDNSRYNPEELFVSSISSCHLLWYLHLCAEAGVIVLNYTDRATGTMIEAPDGSGRFTSVVLHPDVTVADSEMIERAMDLHAIANQRCFIANSLNFEVEHEPVCHT